MLCYSGHRQREKATRVHEKTFSRNRTGQRSQRKRGPTFVLRENRINPNRTSEARQAGKLPPCGSSEVYGLLAQALKKKKKEGELRSLGLSQPRPGHRESGGGCAAQLQPLALRTWYPLFSFFLGFFFFFFIVSNSAGAEVHFKSQELLFISRNS